MKINPVRQLIIKQVECVVGGKKGDVPATCFPAAVDAVITGRDIPIESYDLCHRLVNEEDAVGNRSRKHGRPAYRQLLSDVNGSSSLKAISLKRVRTGDELENVCTEAERSGRVVVGLTASRHAVGIKRLGPDQYQFRGNTDWSIYATQLEAKAIVADAENGVQFTQGYGRMCEDECVDYIEYHEPVMTANQVARRLANKYGMKESHLGRRDRRINNLLLIQVKGKK